MISCSLIALRKPHKSIFHSLFFLPRSTIHCPISIVPSLCFSSTAISSSVSPQDPNIHYKLNHKDWLSPNEVLKIFENLNSNSVTSVWNQYSTRKDYKPNEAIYTVVIKKLAQVKNFDAIEDILQKIKLQKPYRLSDEFFHMVIKIYGRVACRIRKAIEILLDMPKGYNCWPTVKTFNLVLDVLVSAKLFDVVHEVYLKAPMLGVEIDACCLNILIKGLCEGGDLEAAFYVLDEFPKQRCKPNARTFSTLMHGLCRQGKLEEAFGLLEIMEAEGIGADTIMFNILISGLRKHSRVNEGMKLLERMKFKGCEPNAGSYQEVLYGLLDVEKYVEAKEFMARMVHGGMSPSFMSYKKLIDGLCKEKSLVDVDWALKQMIKQGFVPKMSLWRQILHVVFSGGDASSCICFSEIIDG